MILAGDCLALLPAIRSASVDAIVTDPPYGLSFMGRDWDHGVPGEPFWREALRVAKPGAHLLAFGGTRTFHRLACAIEDAGWEIRDCLSWLYGSGFPKSSRVNRDPRFCQCGEPVRSAECSSPELQQEGRSDRDPASGDDAPPPEGVPHSRRTPSGSPIGCRPDFDFDGGHALPVPAVGLASPRLQGCAPVRSRSAELADDLVGGSLHSPSPAQRNGHPSSQDCSPPTESGEDARLGTPAHIATSESTPTLMGNDEPVSRRSRTASESSAWEKDVPGFPKCQGCGKPVVDGFGTALKPAWEPIILARKPLVGTVAANVSAHGTGALNIAACRIGHASADDLATSKAKNPGRSDLVSSAVYGEGRPQQRVNESGRWPANVVLDEDAAAALDAQSGERGGHGEYRLTTETEGRADEAQYRITPGTVRNHGDGGGASRFFYTSKASRAEREAGLSGGERKAKNWSSGDQNPGSFQAEGTDRTSTNHHPTVKPLDLMRWLCRLVTPPGGLILDPFAGSGTTGCAAVLEGFRFLGMEREPEYAEIARRRIVYWESLHQPALDFGGVA